jgi:hypothetical protein
MDTNSSTMELNKILPCNKIILVFRSNIADKSNAVIVCTELKKMDGVYEVNIDLNDWEKILRLECDREIDERRIQQAVTALGFQCNEL